MGAEGFVAPLLGALQACVSVLLTVCYGVAAQRVQLIHKGSIEDMAGLGVKVLLPALTLVRLGEQLHAGNVLNYVPVLIWAILYTSVSVILAQAVSRTFRLPPWVTPTCAFNNTTSLPLLLLQSLESAGGLELLIRDGDTVKHAVSRAQSYFLVCAMVSKTVGYAVGPKLLQVQNGPVDDRQLESDTEEADTQYSQYPQYRSSSTATANEGRGSVDEETTLLAQPRQSTRQILSNWAHDCSTRIISIVPKRIRKEIKVPFESPYADVMLVCTVLGVLLGVVSPLHRAFFNKADDGGIFNAWLTTSVQNIGRLFTTLQIFIVGGKLGLSFEQIRGGSGRIPPRAMVTIFLFRLVLWPAISISVIYALAKKTSILQDDPILWFSMMLMPCGPPAFVISGLADLAGVPESEEIEVAKSLTIMYALSPLVSFSITGALKASEAVLTTRV